MSCNGHYKETDMEESLSERYKAIGKSEWFKNAYHNMSMTEKKVKEETPEVKEITNEEFLNIINIYCPETDIDRVNVIAIVSMVKHGMDKYWKSVIEQKDQEISELNKIIETYISLVDDAAKEINRLEEEKESIKILNEACKSANVSIRERNKKLKAKNQLILNAIAKGDELFKGLNFK